MVQKGSLLGICLDGQGGHVQSEGWDKPENGDDVILRDGFLESLHRIIEMSVIRIARPVVLGIRQL